MVHGNYGTHGGLTPAARSAEMPCVRIPRPGFCVWVPKRRSLVRSAAGTLQHRRNRLRTLRPRKVAINGGGELQAQQNLDAMQAV